MKIRKTNANEMKNEFAGRENDLVVVYTVQSYSDGDGCDCNMSNVKIMKANEAIAELANCKRNGDRDAFTLFIDEKYYSMFTGETGHCGYGAYGDCYSVIAPTIDGFSVEDWDIEDMFKKAKRNVRVKWEPTSEEIVGLSRNMSWKMRAELIGVTIQEIKNTPIEQLTDVVMQMNNDDPSFANKAMTIYGIKETIPIPCYMEDTAEIKRMLKRIYYMSCKVLEVMDIYMSTDEFNH